MAAPPVTPIITLTTDFGTRDHFVGSMKGVILSINPEATIVDIAHDLPPHDVESAAFLIGCASRDFPTMSIHVVVVDPGVGGPRRPIFAMNDWGCFLAPDNGLLTPIYQQSKRVHVRHLTATQYFKASPGQTFHGRDIFAPVAAWLSKGVKPEKFGDVIADAVRLDLPEPKAEGKRLIGRVAYIDRFGNLITNITTKHLDAVAGSAPPRPSRERAGMRGVPAARWRMTIKQATIEGISAFYAERPGGEPQAVINSAGHLEIACYGTNAQTRLAASRGDEVIVTLR